MLARALKAISAGAALLGMVLYPASSGVAAQARLVRVAAQSFHERCVDLLARQPLGYTYAAQRTIDFSIRYREGERDVYPLRRKARSAKAKFIAPVAATYCARWDNTEMHGMTLEYHLTVHKPPRVR